MLEIQYVPDILVVTYTQCSLHCASDSPIVRGGGATPPLFGFPLSLTMAYSYSKLTGRRLDFAPPPQQLPSGWGRTGIQLILPCH